MQTGAAQTLASDNNPSAPSLQGTCEIHIPMADHMGNIRNYIHARSTAVDDGSGTGSTYAMVNFTPSANFEFDAFGREVRANGTTVAATSTPPGLTAGTPYADALPFHFSSKFTDPESGLNYYGYRYYDPKDGRWPSRDPIQEIGFIETNNYPRMLSRKREANLFLFVSNQAVNSFDVLGLTDWGPLGGKCCNNSGGTENALVNGKWVALAPGACTGQCTDCDGMTCGGGFYKIGNLEGGACKTPRKDSPPYDDRRWTPGGHGPGAASPGPGGGTPDHRGAPNNDAPPGYTWD
jgi:RHS repeat-associated protein